MVGKVSKVALELAKDHINDIFKLRFLLAMKTTFLLIFIKF